MKPDTMATTGFLIFKLKIFDYFSITVYFKGNMSFYLCIYILLAEFKIFSNFTKDKGISSLLRSVLGLETCWERKTSCILSLLAQHPVSVHHGGSLYLVSLIFSHLIMLLSVVFFAFIFAWIEDSLLGSAG